MLIHKFIFLIAICNSLNNIPLYIENIYLSNIKFNENFINDFIINLDLQGKNIPKNIISYNVFKIILESENIKEKEKKVIFECNFFGPTNFCNSYLQCLLKSKLESNLKGPFYFREGHFERSFTFKYEKLLYHFSFEILKPTYCFGIIRSFLKSKNLFNMKFDFKNSKTIIPIAMALDDRYTYGTIVAITSIMENSYSYTKYIFYIMHPSEFSIENKRKIQSLEKKYNRCSLKFIDMKELYKTAKTVRYLTTPAYYRLSLSDLLPNINKILYLDGDTLTFSDLKEMYIIDMENYYYKGFLETNIDAFNPKHTLYICSGVLLINLEELRKDDMVNKMNKFMKDNEEKLKKIPFHDQAIINAVCYNKNGILPAKIGIFNYANIKKLKKFYKKYRYKYKYSFNELKLAHFNPLILHFPGIKPWNKRFTRQCNLWWIYAKKTDFYQEICNLFKNNLFLKKIFIKDYNSIFI